MENFLNKPFTFDRVIRIIIGLAIMLVLYLLLSHIKSVLVPFVAAMLVAYLIHPLVSFVKHKMRVKQRFLAVLLVLFFLIGILVGSVALLLPTIIKEIKQFTDLLIPYLSSDEWHKWQVYAEQIISFEKVSQFISGDNFYDIVQQLIPKAWGILSNSIDIFYIIFSLFSFFLYLIFISADYHRVMNGWKKLLPEKYKERVFNVVEDLNQGMHAYFRAQALVAFIVGILFSIGFLIIGMPLAIPLGLFIGLLNMVPYLQIIGFIPAYFLGSLSALELGNSLVLELAIITGIFVIVQIIQEAVLIPKIMGKVSGLNPAIILLSLSVWGSLLGILGMLIAIPMTSLIYIYYQRFIVSIDNSSVNKV